jgi:hypothetical protein
MATTFYSSEIIVLSKRFTSSELNKIIFKKSYSYELVRDLQNKKQLLKIKDNEKI